MFILIITSVKCSDNDLEVEQTPAANLEVQNFIWKGLNLYYLWQANVPNLADNRFSNQTELNNFLKKLYRS